MNQVNNNNCHAAFDEDGEGRRNKKKPRKSRVERETEFVHIYIVYNNIIYYSSARRKISDVYMILRLYARTQ